MAVFLWTAEFQTGLDEVDAQHRRLVDMLNELDEARTIGSDSRLVLGLLDGLTAYTQYHFSTEERLMAAPGFDPEEAGRHHAEHQGFVDKVAEVQRAAHRDPGLVSEDLVAFLMRWLSEHILGSDQSMARLLQPGSRPDRFDETAVGTEALIRALRESEARFRDMADHVPALIWMSDAAGRRSYYNLQWSRYTGLDKASLLKDGWLGQVHPEDAERVGRLYRADANPPEDKVAEYRLRRADGRYRWFWETAVPRFHSDGAFAGEVGCAFDITERRQVEQLLRGAKQRLEAMVEERTTQLSEANAVLRRRYEEQQALTRDLQQAQAQLLQSEKMAGIGQLAAGVAHEINNPLGYVYSNLSVLKGYVADLMGALEACVGLEAELPAEDARRLRLERLWRNLDLEYLREDLPQLIDESMEGADRARKIVQHLRDFARVERSDAAPFDLEGGLENALTVVGKEPGIEVVRDFSGLQPVACAGAELNQVFVQLLSNAVKALAGAGVITLRSGREGTGWVWVEVQDDGTGIPEQDLGRLFDPFFTTRPVGEGTGMGLALAYTIVNQHAGRIEVASRLGEGSRFRVWLPVTPRQAAATQ